MPSFPTLTLATATLFLFMYWTPSLVLSEPTSGDGNALLALQRELLAKELADQLVDRETGVPLIPTNFEPIGQAKVFKVRDPTQLNTCQPTEALSKDECEGRMSTCWVVGGPDVDCPRDEICCFDGCANVCHKGELCKVQIEFQKMNQTICTNDDDMDDDDDDTEEDMDDSDEKEDEEESACKCQVDCKTVQIPVNNTVTKEICEPVEVSEEEKEKPSEKECKNVTDGHDAHIEYKNITIEVPVCRLEPVEKCSATEETKCTLEPQKVCKNVPVACKESKPRCELVTRKVCETVQKEEVKVEQRDVCKEVAVQGECREVPVCIDVAVCVQKIVVDKYEVERCFEPVCKTVNDELCDDAWGGSCRSVSMEFCSERKCKAVWEESSPQTRMDCETERRCEEDGPLKTECDSEIRNVCKTVAVETPHTVEKEVCRDVTEEKCDDPAPCDDQTEERCEVEEVERCVSEPVEKCASEEEEICENVQKLKLVPVEVFKPRVIEVCEPREDEDDASEEPEVKCFTKDVVETVLEEERMCDLVCEDANGNDCSPPDQEMEEKPEEEEEEEDECMIVEVEVPVEVCV